jgi:hypothetical protein
VWLRKCGHGKQQLTDGDRSTHGDADTYCHTNVHSNAGARDTPTCRGHDRVIAQRR